MVSIWAADVLVTIQEFAGDFTGIRHICTFAIISFTSFSIGLICIIIHYSQRLVQYSWGMYSLSRQYLMLPHINEISSLSFRSTDNLGIIQMEKIQQTHSYQPVFAALKGQWFIIFR